MALKSIIYCLLRNSYQRPAYYPLLIVQLHPPFSPGTNELEMPRFYSDLYTYARRFDTNIHPTSYPPANSTDLSH